MAIVSLFCEMDDFLSGVWKISSTPTTPKASKTARNTRAARKLHTSEVMTLLIHFHQSQYRTFKEYHQKHVCLHLRWAFPHLVSYTRFVQLIGAAYVSLFISLHTSLGECSGISFIDATALKICENRRIPSHRVFDGVAGRAKTSMGCFYGFKLHLVINGRGDLLAFRITPGNTADRQPVPALPQGLSWATQRFADTPEVLNLLSNSR